MLQWFNKQTNSSSLSQEAEFAQQQSQHSLSSDSVLTDEDYEFLFNQLLDGVAHGWHLGKIVKFFNNLEPRSIPSQWIAWLLRFEKRIVFSNDPSQRRVGAIMMRFGELTQSDAELHELGAVASKIGKKLFLGNTEELLWEYDGSDVVTLEETPASIDASFDESQDSLEGEPSKLETDLNDSSKVEARISETENSKIVAETAIADSEESIVQFSEERETQFTEQPPLSLDKFSESELLVAENEEELNTLDELLNELDTTQELEAPTTEQPTLSPDLVAQSQPQEEIKQNLLESLEAFTEQLTVLQDIIPESDSPSEEPDLETTLIAPETTKDSATPSVTSFLEATKTLMLQNKENNTTPLSWKEFITALEQDETLARQVARYLQITSNNPQDIVKAAVERLTQQEKDQMSPAKLELIESWFHLGLKQASAEDFQGAIASWDKALKLNSNLTEAWHNRGSALGRLGRYEEAIQSFNRAINLTPSHYQAWNDRAHALYQLHKWEQAIESWNKAISITSDNYQFWYNRGCALEQLQRFEESISSYEKALEIKPNFQPARSRYISLITENSSLN